RVGEAELAQETAPRFPGHAVRISVRARNNTKALCSGNSTSTEGSHKTKEQKGSDGETTGPPN
ncbi:MAG: hypothetical protein ABFS02_11920, partial [Pseudomonadota bacterium]